MKVLILGAKGNLGMQLQQVFADGYEVIAWDREDIDITDKELIVKKITEIKPAIVINAAAYTAVDKCEEDDAEYDKAYKLNVEAPGNLAEACIKSGSILVHFSTDYVFDGRSKNGYAEDALTNPLSKYGKTKAGGEQEIIKRSGKRLKWFLVRTSKLFGPKGDSEIAKPSFFDMMLKIAEDKTDLTVVNSELSCFTYSPDLAAAVKKLVDDDMGYGIYHIMNSEAATWYKAAKELFALTGKKVNITPVAPSKFPRPAKRPKCSMLLNTKLPPMRPYTEALREYLETNNVITSEAK